MKDIDFVPDFILTIKSLIPQIIRDFIFKLYTLFIVWPGWYLYRHSYNFKWFGGYESIPDEDICSQWTGMPSKAFRDSDKMMEECRDMIERRFNSLIIFITCMFYFTMFISIIYFLILYCLKKTEKRLKIIERHMIYKSSSPKFKTQDIKDLNEITKKQN